MRGIIFCVFALVLAGAKEHSWGERTITTVDRAMRPNEAGLPKPTCPRCGSEGIFPIVYGVPTFEMVEESLAGRVEWGDCVAWPESPEWGCLACGHDWRGYRAG